MEHHLKVQRPRGAAQHLLEVMELMAVAEVAAELLQPALLQTLTDKLGLVVMAEVAVEALAQGHLI